MDEEILILMKSFFCKQKTKILTRKFRDFTLNNCYFVKNQFFVKSFIHRLNKFIQKLNPFEFLISNDPVLSDLAHR